MQRATHPYRLFAALLFTPLAALACAPTSPPGPPGPPTEAVAECKNLSDGAPCTVRRQGQAEPGICHTGPGSSGVLACVPAHPPDRPDLTNQAAEACRHQSEGDSCLVRDHDRTLDGACRRGPDASLLCTPGSSAHRPGASRPAL